MLEFLSPSMITFLATFFFVFAIVFALLTYIEIFQKSRGAIAAISAVIGFVTAVYEPVSAFISIMIPYASLVLVVLFFLVFITKIFKSKGEGKEADPLPMALSFAIMLILVGIFWGKIADFLGFSQFNTESIVWIIGIFLIILIFYAVYKAWPSAEKRPA